MDEVDHVFAHGGAMDPVNVPSTLNTSIFCLWVTSTNVDTIMYHTQLCLVNIYIIIQNTLSVV